MNKLLSFFRALWHPKGVYAKEGRIRGAWEYAKVRSRSHYGLGYSWSWLIGKEPSS